MSKRKRKEKKLIEKREGGGGEKYVSKQRERLEKNWKHWWQEMYTRCRMGVGNLLLKLKINNFVTIPHGESIKIYFKKHKHNLTSL